MTSGPLDVWVAGVAETPLGEVTDQTELSMAALAAREALDEAGMDLHDIDGVFAMGFGEASSVQLGEYLGLTPRYADSTDIGGASFELYVHHAALAIAAGHCDVALIAYASRQRSRRLRNMMLAADAYSLSAQFQDSYGLPQPIGHYAMAAARYMHEVGVTPEQLARVAVTARTWAQLNSKAWSREPLTVADVLASPMISDPLHRLDCCLVTDGGGALILTGGSRARDARKRPVRILGAAESHRHWHLTQMPDLTRTPGVNSGRAAFEMAGITAADVDIFEPYDAFTITVLLQLEDLGFCPRGEAGRFVEDGNLDPGGALPAMTMGGGLSYSHPGALGLLLIIEAVRQLRGEAGARQVPDPEIAVAHGNGGFLSAAATVVLARD